MPINKNITIYRRINTTDFTIRCQCSRSEIEIPIKWSLPSDDLLNCTHGEICSVENTLSFPALKRRHNGYYKCHINSISMGFNFLVIG